MRLVLPLASTIVFGGLLTSAVSEEAILARRAVPALVKAKTRCFSSVVHASGHIVPRAKAVVMSSAPGFKIDAIAVKNGDKVESGTQVFTVVPVVSAVSQAPTAAATPLVLRSPVAGTVLEAATTVGMLAIASVPLATLAIDGEVEVAADIPALHAMDLKPGQTVQLSVSDGQPLQGYLRTTPAVFDPRTRLGQARISIDAERAPEIDRVVDVSIEIARSCNVAVPLTALIRDGGSAALRVARGGSIETRPVRIGLSDEANAEIREGVVEGDMVVADAEASVRDSDVPGLRPLKRSDAR